MKALILCQLVKDGPDRALCARILQDKDDPTEPAKEMLMDAAGIDVLMTEQAERICDTSTDIYCLSSMAKGYFNWHFMLVWC